MKIKKWLKRTGIALVLLYAILLIPGSDSSSIYKAPPRSFYWNRDTQWLALEQRFQQVKKDTGAPAAAEQLFTLANNMLLQLQQAKHLPADSLFTAIQNNFFTLAPYVATLPALQQRYIEHYKQVRYAAKLQSQQWDMNSTASRNTIYTLLYGMRAAVEETLLQGNGKFEAAMLCNNEASATPAAKIFGIEVHSGDLLVSRGGAEVSALISRGNDYPGNFSHVALVYVDNTGNAYLIEAHIEKGVAIANVQQYEADKKMRFMVLRPRADLPALKSNPLLPHTAARYAYEAAQKRHIPYDFKMDFVDTSAMFCSEVGSYAYHNKGVQLWQGLSTISSQGVVNWLNAFGVEHFITQMPADLEYDPQLTVVAEWRDPATLAKDHIDNAVMDVMLEQADKGSTVGYNHWLLPVVRMMKGWSWLLNKMGKVGKIPEGMSATQALKNQYVVDMHQAINKETKALADGFIKEHQYFPPYWQLVALAKQACQKLYGK
jgi:Permuted papain-like amidase enzyme, YaeF/YiiX, C92 family